MRYLRWAFLLALLLPIGCAPAGKVMDGNDATSRVTGAVGVARKAALSQPGLSEEARTRIRDADPRTTSFVDQGVLVECTYFWKTDAQHEIAVRYHGDPMKHGNEPTLQILPTRD